jgi:hypothetical protein
MEGLAGYVALLWYRKSLGNNEHRLLLYRQGLYVCDRGQDIVLAKCGVCMSKPPLLYHEPIA